MTKGTVPLSVRALAIALLVVLPACGVETATTAATGAAIKKQEVDQGRQTMDDTREKIEQAAQQAQQRAEQTDAATDK